MNLATVDQIAKAILYEGYMLYPYRPSSVKNQQRWNFGVLCPRSYSELHNGTEAWTMRTECLIESNPHMQLEVRVRFLQLVARTVGELTTPLSGLPSSESPKFHLVEKLSLNDRIYQPWQEAVEREVILGMYGACSQAAKPVTTNFHYAAEMKFEYLCDKDRTVGVIVREQRPLSGMIEVIGEPVQDGLVKVTVLIRNTTDFDVTKETVRDTALLSALVSTHTILGAGNGGFVSLLDPPEQLRELATTCKNAGTWPVLVGTQGQRDTLLSSPIILYDYPQIARESAGDLFDGTEIDEILSLRIMTLTDEEKREMSESDERARKMLERTETMPVEQLMKLHGVLRRLRPLNEEGQ